MEGPGRTQALGIGVGKGDRALNAAPWGCAWGSKQEDTNGKECLGEGLPWWETFGGDFETTKAGEDIGDEEGMIEKN